MKKNTPTLSETELEIMTVLWTHPDPMTPTALITFFTDHTTHQWKRQTLSTFLSRLTEKGMITSEKQGRELYYRPKITEKQYTSKQSRNLLKDLYQGSVKNFLASLTDEKPSPQELQEVKDWISQLEQED